MNKTIILWYGSQDRTVTVSNDTSIGKILDDTTNKIVLGYGDNVKALVHGVEQPMDVIPEDGSEITIENKANQKAS